MAYLKKWRQIQKGVTLILNNSDVDTDVEDSSELSCSSASSVRSVDDTVNTNSEHNERKGIRLKADSEIDEDYVLSCDSDAETSQIPAKPVLSAHQVVKQFGRLMRHHLETQWEFFQMS